MVHVDLFSGIGGFALAADEVFGNVEHIFCEWDDFCQNVLKKHWPESEIFEDVRSLTSNANFQRHVHGRSEVESTKGRKQTLSKSESSIESPFLLTGGFPCQPFSAAGVRRGTNDERYLWPAMLEVIRYCQPTWVIAENVGGLLTWEEGLVFEQVCSDLESAGYEVQPFIIPAAAVGAPHRRDRIWFVAHSLDSRPSGAKPRSDGAPEKLQRVDRQENSSARQSKRADSHGTADRPNPDTSSEGLQGSAGRGKKERSNGLASDSNVTDSSYQRLQGSERPESSSKRTGTPRPAAERSSDVENSRGVRGRGRSHGDSGRDGREIQDERSGWSRNWVEVATELCGVDDGLPGRMGDTTISKSRHRKEQLKAYGNAIVPQVAMEIMRGMK